jgi:hypothetical protein
MNLRRQILGIRGIPSQGSHGQMMKWWDRILHDITLW